ncbi:hypothetical protein L7F22_003956 [Adiantum nelumboides]|nr:hypothetical protein [Adiantum nelumboides]
MEEDDGTLRNSAASELIQDEENPEEQQGCQSSSLLSPPSPLPPPPPPSSPAPIPTSENAGDGVKEVEKDEHGYQHVGPPPSRLPLGPRPAPTYEPIVYLSDTETDHPGSRCAHTLTAVLAVGDENSPTYIGPRLILFGGANSIEDGSQAAGPQSIGGGAGIRLAGVTNDVHCYDILSNKWTSLYIVYKISQVMSLQT